MWQLAYPFEMPTLTAPLIRAPICDSSADRLVDDVGRQLLSSQRSSPETASSPEPDTTTHCTWWAEWWNHALSHVSFEVTCCRPPPPLIIHSFSGHLKRLVSWASDHFHGRLPDASGGPTWLLPFSWNSVLFTPCSAFATVFARVCALLTSARFRKVNGVLPVTF